VPLVPLPPVPLPPVPNVEPEQAATMNAETKGKAGRDRARMELIIIAE
jgi:hypothetical protein